MKNFKDWFFQPFIDIITLNSSPQTVIIENFKEEDNEIPPDLHPQPNEKRLFRPESFDAYIGQERAKTILKDYISAMKARGQIMPHVLISGSAGCGKTTLAKIISNNFNCNFKEIITSTLDNPNELLECIHEVNGGILFMDEIHSIDIKTAERIYSVMEDFSLNGISIKPFTLIGATTELGDMISKLRPFVDRFKILIELEDYTVPELSVMSRQYRLNMFPYDDIDFKLHDKIANNCRNTPRTNIRLTEALVYMGGDIQKVLRSFGIIRDGYTEKDLKVLKHIASQEKGVGLEGLCSFLNTSAKNYKYDIEPFLIRNGLISRTPRGRKITVAGIQKIKDLQ